MATRKIETPASLAAQALKAAQAAISATVKAKGHSKVFTASVLRLGVIGTDEAITEADTLGKALTELVGGKGYASNARRILSAGKVACQKALDHCEDPANGGFMAPANLFKAFPEDFPTLTDSGRAKKVEDKAANDGVSLSTPAGWKVACMALCANVQGQKAWTLDDIAACRDSAQKILAILKRNAV